MAGKLTALGVKAAVKPGRYGDGDGLHLYVRDADRRTWVLRYMRDGKSRDMGLGAYPDVSLAEARDRRLRHGRRSRTGKTHWKNGGRSRPRPPSHRGARSAPQPRN